MSSVLLASGVISKAINCDVVLSGDEIMPTDLYDVDFDQALQKNLKSADVIVLGDFEFQDTRVSVRTDVSAQTLSETVTVAGNSPELTLKNKVNDGKIKMMVVSEEEIEQQCGESSADVIRHATDNGYVMFFNTSSYEDIHRITADIYEDYGVIYGAKSVNKSTKTIDFAENQNLSYFFVTKTKDNCVDFHFVLSNVKDNPSAVERSMLEHAYANRNMGMYVKNQEEYLASKRAERVRNGDVSSASAKGLLNPTVNGVNFHGDWKRSFNESVFIYEYWHVNYHPDIKHRITVTTCELMSHDLVNGQRLWAQVANIDLKVNNTSSTDRLFANRNVWWWCEEETSAATLKTYAPSNAPKSTTYTYGINGELSGGVSGSTDGAGATAGIKLGASFSKSISVNDVEYYTNAFETGINSGTTFNAVFTRGSQYAQNHSVHTTVTFFTQDKSCTDFAFFNKLNHQSSAKIVGIWSDSKTYEWDYEMVYRWSTNASDYYFK